MHERMDRCVQKQKKRQPGSDPLHIQLRWEVYVRLNFSFCDSTHTSLWSSGAFNLAFVRT